MSITFHQDEGTRTTVRQITGIAAGVMTTNAALSATVTIGDMVEIFVGANSGFYTVIGLPGANQYTLRPTPANQGASGVNATARLNRNADRGISVAPTSITALANGMALIVAAANFQTQDVRRNDRVVLIGSATAGNNGGWYVQTVIDETQVVVRPPDGGAGMATDAAPGGTLTVRSGTHNFDFLNEAALTMDFVIASAVPAAAPTNKFGSGVVSDYIRKRVVAGPLARAFYDMEGLKIWSFDQSGLGGGSAWTAVNELWIQCSKETVLTWNKVGTWAGPLVLTAGVTEGDDVSAKDGSAIVGVNHGGLLLPGSFRGNAYGSYIDSNNFQQNDGTVVGCVIRGGNIALSTSAGGTIRNLTVYGEQALVVSGAGAQSGLLISEGTLAAVIQAPATIGGLLLSANSVLPAFNYTYNGGVEPLVFLDPQEDYDLPGIVKFASTNRFSFKEYTYNPRFVYATVPPTPAMGVTVRIVEVNEDDLSEVEIAVDTLDANGRLSGGALLLKRQEASGTGTAVADNYTHRVEFDVGSPQTFQMRGPVTGDRPDGVIPGEFVVGAPISVEVATVPVEVVIQTPVVAVDAATGVVEVEVL